MPETITCPECQLKVRLPDNLMGKRVKCPSCNAAFIAQASSAPAPAYSQEPQPFPPLGDEPAPPPRERDRGRDRDDYDDDRGYRQDRETASVPPGETADWAGVRTGLSLQSVCHIVQMSGWGAILLAFLMMTLMGRRGGGEIIVSIFGLLGALAVLVAWIGSLVAGCFFIAVPPRRNARGFAVGALAMTGLVILQLGSVASFVGSLDRRGGDGGAVIVVPALLTSMCEIARLTLLALLLRAAAQATSLRSLSGTGKMLSILTPSLLSGVIFMGILLIMVEPSPVVALIVMTLDLGAFITILILELLLMSKLKQKLAHALPAKEPE